MDSINSFFDDIVSRNPKSFDMKRLSYIAVTEWHWNQDDLMSADIPFVLDLLDERASDIKRQEKEYKKGKGKIR